jgi:hypothetical protein
MMMKQNLLGLLSRAQRALDAPAGSFIGHAKPPKVALSGRENEGGKHMASLLPARPLGIRPLATGVIYDRRKPIPR